ncbi:MAG: FkbM family methyltransferase [Candidatus Eisenbacteria bacterium]
MSLKSLVLQSAPEFLLIRMKARRYCRLLRHLPMDEEPEFAPIPPLLKEGDGAVDVGANFGIYTRLLSNLVGAEGEVHSFEPVIHTYRVLLSCLARLDVANVKAYPLALSDRRGEGLMKCPSYRDGGGNYYQSFVAEGKKLGSPGQEFTVPLRCMDDALPENTKPIRFIKIDVEGHELPVAHGARRTLEKWKPALLIEVSRNPDDPESSTGELFAFLASLGYEPYWISPGGLVRREKAVRSVNYFFFTEDHVRTLRKAGHLAGD